MTGVFGPPSLQRNCFLKGFEPMHPISVEWIDVDVVEPCDFTLCDERAVGVLLVQLAETRVGFKACDIHLTKLTKNLVHEAVRRQALGGQMSLELAAA